MPAGRGALLPLLPLLLAGGEFLWIDVPYVRQPPEGCGAASLAMVVRYWQRHDRDIADAAADTEQIQRRLYSPALRGIRAADMGAYLREQGFRAFDFTGEWADLERHIGLGRPLIACLEPQPGAPLHYVIVAGAGPGGVLLNDPAVGKLVRMERSVFERRWSGCNRWTLLALPARRQAAMPRGNPAAAPDDAYANQRLATLYFIEGNYAAAVKYWNRVGEPRLDEVLFVPPLRLDPLLASRLWPVARGDLLTPAKLRYTERLLDGLGSLASRRVELVALPEQRYQLEIRTSARPRYPHPATVLGEAMFLAFHFDFYNLGGSGGNWTSMVRLDARKRRLTGAFDAPWRSRPRWRYAFSADARKEVWNTGAEDFRVNRTEGGFDLRVAATSRVEWGSGLHFSRRDFGGAAGLGGGGALEYGTWLGWRLLDLPERSLTVDSVSSWRIARMVSGERQLYSRGQWRLATEWRPNPAYAVHARVSAGASAGRPPFDELFMLGLERDNDLPLRAHIGTREGKKGSSPLARDYLLTNLELDRMVYRHGLFSLSAGPLFDTARVAGAFRPADNRWYCDGGAQVKLRVLGVWEAAFSYGRDLRGNRNAWYLAVGKAR